MANQQLTCSTPSGNKGRTFCLSEETQLIVHPRTPFKHPYITLTRVYPHRDISRQVHISMTGFSCLKDKIQELKDAFTREEDREWMITRRQKVSIHKFPKNDQMYTSITLIDKETGEPDRTKTMNLGKDEFNKFVEILEEVDSALQKREQYTRTRPDRAEETLAAYRWRVQLKSGRVETSCKAYLNKIECQEALKEILENQTKQGVECAMDEVFEESVVLPSQFKVIEMVLAIVVRVFLRDKVTKNCTGCINEEANQLGHIDGCLKDPEPISMKDVQETINQFKRCDIIGLVEYVIRRLKYISYVRHAVEMFFYFDGVQKVTDSYHSDVQETTLFSIVYDLTDEAMLLFNQSDSDVSAI